jgi:peptidoglycan/xylan/chitin deacetylase (PgdA/CDA1 family)
VSSYRRAPGPRRQPPSRYGSTLQPAYRRRRRTRRAGLTRLAVLLIFIAAVVAALIAATSSGSGSPSNQAARPPVKPAAAAHAAKHTSGHSQAASHAAAAVAAPSAPSIDHVLGYTPFVTGGTPKHRVVALTFDDGPSPYTESVVSVLVRMHVPATFFVVGQQLTDFSAGLKDELRHGFVIGDHTENHAYLTQLSAAGVYRQVHDDAVRIAHLGAPFPRLFRPPYGAYNSQTLATLKQFKMLMTLWSVDTSDWTRPGTGAIVRRALSGARPGAIILLHDGGGNRSQTVAALPAIINGLRRRHYELVTVPQLLAMDPPPRGQRLPHVAE